jgi:hypothetical protein
VLPILARLHSGLPFTLGGLLLEEGDVPTVREDVLLKVMATQLKPLGGSYFSSSLPRLRKRIDQLLLRIGGRPSLLA